MYMPNCDDDGEGVSGYMGAESRADLGRAYFEDFKVGAAGVVGCEDWVGGKGRSGDMAEAGAEESAYHGGLMEELYWMVRDVEVVAAAKAEGICTSALS